MRERNLVNISQEASDLARGATLSDQEFTPFLASWAKKLASTFEEGLKARQKLEDKILKSVSKVLAKAGGRKGLTIASALALVANACAPLFSRPDPTPITPESSPTPEIVGLDFDELEDLTQEYSGLEVNIQNVVPGVLSTGPDQKYTLAESIWNSRGVDRNLPLLISLGERGEVRDIDGLALDERFQTPDVNLFLGFDINGEEAYLTNRNIRTNTETGQIFIFNQGSNSWVELTGQDEVKEEMGRGLGVEAAPLALQDLTPTPPPIEIPTDIPIPTEIPRYEGELADITIFQTYHIPWSGRENRNLVDMAIFQISFERPITLVSQTRLRGTGISEQIWGFRLRDKDYYFRTTSAECSFEHNDPQVRYAQIGDTLENMSIGKNYFLSFGGLEESLSQSKLNKMSAGCRIVWGDLVAASEYPEDIVQIIKQFFWYGETSNFEVDEDGVVDFRKVMTPYIAIQSTY